MADLADGALVTGRASHEIFVVRDGKRWWVPDAWILHAENLSPADLRILDDQELGDIPLGDVVDSAMPTPPLDDGDLVETDDYVFEVKGGKLHKILDPPELVVEGKPPESVTFPRHQFAANFATRVGRRIFQQSPPAVSLRDSADVFLSKHSSLGGGLRGRSDGV
jgi:hypothetical protein